MHAIMVSLNCAIIFGCIYKVVELFVHKRERLLLISKITELKNIDFKGINLYGNGNKYTSLRVGWLLLGVGCGLLLGFCINMLATFGDYSFNADESRMILYTDGVGGIIYVACVCVCGGLGLLMSYRAERKAWHPQGKNDESEA